MSTTNEFGYDHVFRLAQNLSPEDRDRLLRELASPKTEPVRSGPTEKNQGTLTIETVDTGNPIFTAEDFARFEKNRQALLASIDWGQAEKNHEELGRLLRECPIATEEEIEMQDEIRRSMERWKT